MATIGLDRLYYAKITENDAGEETYGTPEQLAKAISADLSVELAEATLYADDGASEIVKEFKSGTLSLGIDDIGSAAASDLTGATIDKNKVLISASEDGGDPVAVGFRAKKSNGKYKYYWLYRVKFGIPATNLATKGDSISIPGRSGDIINPNRRFANIKVTYTVFLARKNVAALASALRDIKGWLYSEPDRYHELTDSYDVKYFRYGVISGTLDIEEQLNKVGSFTVTFNCKPYKYSFAGQQTVSADASELTITNPTAFESRPYIKLYGGGTVVIMIQPQGRGMMISNLDEYIEIDSELMNCFKGTALKDDTVKGTEFPVFKPGVCTINCTGDVTRIEVIPRWCCL